MLYCGVLFIELEMHKSVKEVLHRTTGRMASIEDIYRKKNS